MFKSFAGFGAAALIALGVALGGSTANAESVMKQCGDQWQAAKAAGTTNGQTWPQFLSQCRAQLKTGAAAPSNAAAPATAAPAPAPAPAATTKTAKECDAEYAANKAAIKASGQTKRAFVAACRAGNETLGMGNAPEVVREVGVHHLARLGRLNESHSSVKAGLALHPSFAIDRARADWTATSDDPTYLARLEPIFDGLRKAGVPDQ